jgi:hypothetical protein
MKARYTVPKIDSRFTRRAGYLWLLGILLSIFPAFASQIRVDPDLIFCPLQKTWVKKGGVSVKSSTPLRNICASQTAKREFSFESYKRLGTAFNDSLAEPVFFSYSKIGRRAFDAVRSVPVPDESLSGSGYSEKSAANGQVVPERKDVATVVIDPPSFAYAGSAESSVGSPVVSESTAPERNSRPRAPPVSL